MSVRLITVGIFWVEFTFVATEMLFYFVDGGLIIKRRIDFFFGSSFGSWLLDLGRASVVVL